MANDDKSRIEGEGSYSGTEDYNGRTDKFIKSGKVDEAAKDAVHAIDSPEAAQLKQAEERGKKGDPRDMDKKR
jgi:hypothetical protein